MSKIRAIFLDRDNTINEDPGYLNDASRVALKPGALEALQRLQAAGYLFYIISNQSGIGRGLITLDQLQAVNERLLELLAVGGVAIEEFYICPHHPDEKCRCRKPQPGLIEAALEDHPIDPAASYMVGDRLSDILAAEPLSIGAILVHDPLPADKQRPANLLLEAATIAEAAEYILSRGGSG